MADAQAKAAALLRREAELAGGADAAKASTLAPSKRQMTLGDAAFVRGQSVLDDAGVARIAGIVDFVDAVPGSRIRIQASAGGDHRLATARAEAVRDALVSAGVAADRIRATGANAKGGKSSRVEITLEGSD
jgi:outer membrane protein OmpA-like peptidoglycan-associated protein